MEFSNIKAQERTIDILHPATGEKTGVTVTLMSLEDERLKKLRRKLQDRRLYLEQRGKTFNSEELETNANELAFASIISWNWGENQFHGEVPEFSRASAMQVFEELPWFREQIDSALGDVKSFFAK